MKYLVLVLMLAGCATSSGVLPEGLDSYVVSREGATAFVGVNGLKSAAYREAGEYCTSHGKSIQVTSTTDHPGGLGIYPLAEVHFMCLSPGDPQLQRTNMRPLPNSVVEIRNQ